MTSGEMSNGSLTDERVSAIASTASVRTAIAALPGRLRVGGGDVFVPDRRGSCRTWREHLGPLLHDPGGDHRRQQRRCRVRPPRACRWRRAADDRTRHRRLPVLDLLAAGHPAGGAATFPRRASTSTTGSSISCSPPASTRTSRCTTGTCPRRWRTRAGGRSGRRRTTSPSTPTSSPPPSATGSSTGPRSTSRTARATSGTSPGSWPPAARRSPTDSPPPTTCCSVMAWPSSACAPVCPTPRSGSS